MFLSASETHNRKNVNRSTEESLDKQVDELVRAVLIISANRHGALIVVEPAASNAAAASAPKPPRPCRLPPAASRGWWSGLASASLRPLPPCASSLALPSAP